MNDSCCFAGHADLWGEDPSLKRRLEMTIRKLITEYGVTQFYSGNMGGFDRMAEGIVSRLKAEYPDIRLYKVLAYHPGEARDLEEQNFYDEIIYPFIDRVYYKAAIVKRNRWMVERCSHMAAFVNKTYGGAYASLQYARKQGVTIWNMGDLPAEQ